MAISKKTRLAVYEKYDGHCAYCGREIRYEDMKFTVIYFFTVKNCGKQKFILRAPGNTKKIRCIVKIY